MTLVKEEKKSGLRGKNLYTKSLSERVKLKNIKSNLTYKFENTTIAQFSADNEFPTQVTRKIQPTAKQKKANKIYEY